VIFLYKLSPHIKYEISISMNEDIKLRYIVVGGWVGRCIHFVHLAKVEFKLKLCFQNDLIRFIGDKLDIISKLILVCMRYFILIEISYFIWGDNL
jgi:hypothetical protein